MHPNIVSAAEGPRRPGGEGQGGAAGGALPPLGEEVFLSRESKRVLVVGGNLVALAGGGKRNGVVFRTGSDGGGDVRRPWCLGLRFVCASLVF